jgi:hypothetical protein
MEKLDSDDGRWFLHDEAESRALRGSDACQLMIMCDLFHPEGVLYLHEWLAVHEEAIIASVRVSQPDPVDLRFLFGPHPAIRAFLEELVKLVRSVRVQRAEVYRNNNRWRIPERFAENYAEFCVLKKWLADARAELRKH